MSIDTTLSKLAVGNEISPHSLKGKSLFWSMEKQHPKGHKGDKEAAAKEIMKREKRGLRI